MTWTNRRLTGLCVLAALPFLAHCGDDDGMTDSGMADTGMADSDMPDSDMPDSDMPDTGMMDGGDAMLVSIEVSPDTITLDIDGTETLSVMGTYDDDSMAAVTDGLSFESSMDEVATVDATGVVTGVAEGMATITASVGDLTDDATVTVNPPGRDDVVFDDDFGPNVLFAPFGGSVNDVGPSTDEAMVGTSSLRIVVPATDYTGGALVLDAGVTRDLTAYDAITFYAKADSAHSLNVAGFGDDTAGDTNFKTEIAGGLALTTDWAQFTIPVPNPAKLDAAVALFHFAEGSDEGAYTIYLDEIRYVDLADGTVTDPRPAMATETISRSETSTFAIQGTSVVFDVGGSDLTLAPAGRAFFDFTPADTAIATVDAVGVVTAVAVGTTTITGELAGTAATGTLTFEVTPDLTPGVAAPTPPARAAGDVISIFSNAYTNETVDTFRTPWSDGRTVLNMTTIAGDDVLFYENMLFAGIETVAMQIDATAMTHVHIDYWVEGTSVIGQVFSLKLVDFGADGMFGGGDDTDAELIYTPSGAPSGMLTTGSWQSLDVPLSRFEPSGSPPVGGLVNRANLAQYVLKSEIPPNITTNLWIDNFYFYRVP